MKRYKLALLVTLAAGIATNVNANPVVNVTPGIKGGICQSWELYCGMYR